jgi:hypothetical protein
MAAEHAISATPKVIFAINRARERARGDCHDRQSPPVRMGADRPSLCFTLRIRGFWRGHFGLTVGTATPMAGLSAFATRLGGELWIL